MEHTPVYRVTLFEATYVGWTCLAVTCHLYFRQNDGVFYELLRQHRGGTDTEIESAQKVDPAEVNSPAALAGIRTRDLSITSAVV